MIAGTSRASCRQKFVAVRGVSAHALVSATNVKAVAATRVAMWVRVRTHWRNELVPVIFKKVIALKYLRLNIEFGVMSLVSHIVENSSRITSRKCKRK